MRLLAVAFLFAFAAVTPAKADEVPEIISRCAALAAYMWEPGFEASGGRWDEIDVEAALPVCLAAHQAVPEDSPTTFRLARIYLQIHDRAQAMTLLLQASEAGYAPAQAAYGTEFMNGKGQQDTLVALRWLNAAARSGNPVAKANLGLMYNGQYGIPANADRYISLQTEAATAGVDFAQYNIGWSYQFGYGVAQDMNAAKSWYGLAAEQGHNVARCALARILIQEAAIESDYEEPVRLLRAAAKDEYASSITLLGWLSLKGHGVPLDVAKARENFERGYRLGDRDAASELGLLYEFGKGVEQDRQRAFNYYVQAAYAGNITGQYRLGIFVQSGWGGAIKDRDAALEWFLRAAYQGSVSAQMAVGQLYSTLYQDEQAPIYDPEKALYWYDVAAAAGSLEAMLEAAVLYAHKAEFETAEAYVSHVLEYGDEIVAEHARLTLERVRFIKRNRRLPS